MSTSYDFTLELEKAADKFNVKVIKLDHALIIYFGKSNRLEVSTMGMGPGTTILSQVPDAVTQSYVKGLNYKICQAFPNTQVYMQSDIIGMDEPEYWGELTIALVQKLKDVVQKSEC
uniref:Hydrogenase expression/formation protein n=1 Tax=Rhabditophanes sp. KR3021 TaxID=114890 RepID=A0AC35TV80_9BILA